MWRSEDEMLERVARRARALRIRRRASVLGTLAAVAGLAAIVSAVLVPGAGPGDGQRLEVVAPSTTTTAATTTTAVPHSATTEPLSTVPLSPGPPSTAAPPTTAAASGLAHTGGAETTTTQLEYDWCTSEDFSLEVDVERDTYALGEVVRASTRYVHTSDEPCIFNSTYERVRWFDALTGEEVGGPSATLHGDCFAPCDPPSAPGRVVEGSWCWDQRGGSPRQPVPPGLYEVEIFLSYGGGLTATATFEIVDLPSTSTTLPTTTTFPARC